jgi:hypothetical protein
MRSAYLSIEVLITLGWSSDQIDAAIGQPSGTVKALRYGDIETSADMIAALDQLCRNNPVSRKLPRRIGKNKTWG